MGIGVSFRGHDGRTRKFNLTDVPQVGDEAAKVLGEQQRSVRDALSKQLFPEMNFYGGGGGGESGKVRLNGGDNSPGTLEEKLDPNGSIEASDNGVRLKGDDTAVFGDCAVYGKIGGKSDFRALADYDQGAKDAERIGVVGVGGKDPEKSSGSGSAIWQTISRLRIEENDLGQKILCQYERDVRKTAFGRTVEVGEERKSEIGFISGGAGGNGGENGEDGKDGKITLISGNDTYICFNGEWSSSGITGNKFTVDLYYI